MGEYARDEPATEGTQGPRQRGELGTGDSGWAPGSKGVCHLSFQVTKPGPLMVPPIWTENDARLGRPGGWRTRGTQTAPLYASLFLWPASAGSLQTACLVHECLGNCSDRGWQTLWFSLVRGKPGPPNRSRPWVGLTPRWEEGVLK